MVTTTEPGSEVNRAELTSYEEVTFEKIEKLSARLGRMMDQMRSKGWAPINEKTAPHFNQSQLAALCNLKLDAMIRRLAKAKDYGLPEGRSILEVDKTFEGADRKVWTLAEARRWIIECVKPYRRKPGQKACVITTALFKGGVAKTVTSVSLAQALTLLGYRTLLIDLDPQASASTLAGVKDADEGMTLLPIFRPKLTPDDIERARTLESLTSKAEGREYEEPFPEGATNLPRDTVKESINPTYWDGMDVIAANRSLFGAEFMLPSRQMREEGFEFWNVMRSALDDGTLDAYDFVIIDTPPALSYVTMNALWAGDGVLMPLPPEGLDIASSSQYWTMFVELASLVPKEKKSFKFINVLPTKVDQTKPTTGKLLSVIRQAYGAMVLPVEVPTSVVVSTSGTTFKTVYDITRYAGAQKTYQRAREAFDKVALELEKQARLACWKEA
ncbi:MAG: cobyrinic acid a,c-diamide synthase [Nevskiaceae bacterium]|nr:MAG: cobyrinic acid a,c-diamide synthase [Nevskiaceae bacterium]